MNDNTYLVEQYKTPDNLEARITLHERFNTNSYPWMRWVFDQFGLPSRAAILEVGCGIGKLWAENSDRLPVDWSITLIDQSAGMLEQAKANLSKRAQLFQFQQCDVQSLPFGDGSFDAVVANHMLYCVTDLPRGLAEIRRVLKPGGTLFAATNGERHMRELRELIQSFDPNSSRDFGHLSFRLEDGPAWLSPYFDAVVLRRYESALAITEAAPLIDYVFSMSSYKIPEAQRTAFAQHVEETLRNHNGVLHIQKDTGLFVAHKAGR